MPDLTFQIQSVQPVLYAATPLLALKLHIKARESGTFIQNIILQCQIQIEPSRRRYHPAEQEKLRDLFGEPVRWGQTLRPMLWTNTSVVVPSFKEETIAEVPIPCTFDFNVAATKYFHGLQGGDVPICVLFSGTVFFMTDEGTCQVGKIPWDREVTYRLSVDIWKEMMDRYYPNTAWLCLQRDVFDQLHQYKVNRGIPTWEDVFRGMLSNIEERSAESPGVRLTR